MRCCWQVGRGLRFPDLLKRILLAGSLGGGGVGAGGMHFKKREFSRASKTYLNLLAGGSEGKRFPGLPKRMLLAGGKGGGGRGCVFQAS